MRTASQTCMFNIRNFVKNYNRTFPTNEMEFVKKQIKLGLVPPSAVKLYSKALLINKSKQDLNNPKLKTVALMTLNSI